MVFLQKVANVFSYTLHFIARKYSSLSLNTYNSSMSVNIYNSSVPPRTVIIRHVF